MFTKSLLTAAMMAGVMVEAANLERVSSSNGVIYNCPMIETIEVAYAKSCESSYPPDDLSLLIIGPTQSKNSLFQLTGASSGAYYGNAPENYRVDNGYYNLVCFYGKTASGQVGLITQHPYISC